MANSKITPVTHFISPSCAFWALGLAGCGGDPRNLFRLFRSSSTIDVLNVKCFVADVALARWTDGRTRTADSRARTRPPWSGTCPAAAANRRATTDWTRETNRTGRRNANSQSVRSPNQMKCHEAMCAQRATAHALLSYSRAAARPAIPLLSLRNDCDLPSRNME